MSKQIIQISALLILLFSAAMITGCDSGPSNTPLPKGEVPEWQKRNMNSANHPHDPNLPAGEK